MNSYLLNRPVNALKKLYAPSYLGAKIRASKANNTVNKIQELAIKKRLHSSENWNYKVFKVFKGLNEHQNPEYRDYLAPSPSTAMAEAYILNEISADISATRAENVYSYVTAKKGASYNYEYYLPNYQRRNKEILNSLTSLKSGSALFLDLKNYYASVDKDSLILLIKSNKYLNNNNNKYIIDFLINQINQSPNGIPIGTELSHLLGDIFLSPLDLYLKNLLGCNYFRYVDDITIVCSPNEVDKFEKDIKNKIESFGLKLNDSKREVFCESKWRNEIDTSPVEGDDFYEYCRMLGHWIGDDLTRKNWLQDELTNEGFQIPLRKIVGSRHSSFNSGEKIQSQKEIIKTSVEMRKKYLDALHRVSENLNQDSSRWYLQKTKRAINPLFYLLNKQDYRTITDTAKESNKLKTQEEVSNALQKNTCSNIIKYPGVTVSTFCEIWQTIQPKDSKLDDIETFEPTLPEIESLTTLALYEILPPQKQILDSSIWLALRPDVRFRTATLNGFDAEIESLRIGVSDAKQRSLLDNRLTEDEDVFLSGLELGNQSISP